MRELLIATGRQGKVDEIRAMLAGAPFTVVGLADLGIPADVEEVGTTYEANALTKAFIYGKRSGKLTLSEDSGFEIDHLGGKPGVFTAEYAAGTPDGGCTKTLDALMRVPEEKRGATARSVIVVYDPSNDKIRMSEGESRGRIALAIRGGGGFGHDPIFFYDNGEKTGGEMTTEEKNRVSHRSRAFAKMKEILLKEFV
jgi:XTP/dITP diphosphohydrolase